MNISDPISKHTTSYIRNYKKDFEKDLDIDHAYNSLFNLVGFVKVLKRIDKRLKLEKQFKTKSNSDDKIVMETT